MNVTTLNIDFDLQITEVSALVHMLPGINNIEYVFSRFHKTLAININGQEALFFTGEKAVQVNNLAKGLDSNSDILEEKIKLMTEWAYDLDFDALTVRTRKREIVEIRQIIMRWCKNNTKWSDARTGLFMGGFDHATVLHATKIIDNLITTNQIIHEKAKRFEMAAMRNYDEEIKQRLNTQKQWTD